MLLDLVIVMVKSYGSALNKLTNLWNEQREQGGRSQLLKNSISVYTFIYRSAFTQRVALSVVVLRHHFACIIYMATLMKTNRGNFRIIRFIALNCFDYIVYIIYV